MNNHPEAKLTDDDTFECVADNQRLRQQRLGSDHNAFSVDDVGFFEGTEKLLEIWFSLSKRCYNTKGLREIPRYITKYHSVMHNIIIIYHLLCCGLQNTVGPAPRTCSVPDCNCGKQ